MTIRSLVKRNRGKFEIGITSLCIIFIYYQHTTSSSCRYMIERYDEQVRKFKVARRTRQESVKILQEAMENFRSENKKCAVERNNLRDELRQEAQLREKLQTKEAELKATAIVLQTLSSKLEELHHENQVLKDELQKSIRSEKDPDSLASTCSANQRHLQDELRKRRIRNDVLELKYSFKAMFKRDTKSYAENGDVRRILQQITSALIDADNVVDASSEWKRNEMDKLQEVVRKRIDHLQNPEDCEKARKLVCKLNKKCGFGCQLHHLNLCFMIAYGTQRTLIIASETWSYSKAGWESFFQPSSRTCPRRTELPYSVADEDATGDALEVVIKSVEMLKKTPPYVPLAIPTEFADTLKTIHGEPGVWWVGQFIKYLLRPADGLRIELEKYEAAVDYSKPIVGIHVRRTDKLFREASYHGIEQYMEHVEEWYEQYAMKHTNVDLTRSVYLATDDPSVFPEAKKKYPNYNFTHSTSFSQSAVFSRYSADGLLGVVADIHLLSKCNYIVCTFSSQVCRVTYELMQTLHPDASSYFHSLDDTYYYGGGSAHEHVAVYDHEPGPGEIQLRVGDVIGVEGNHWNGYSKGTNKRDGSKGMFPSYKVQDVIKLVNYPTYSTVH